MKEILIWYSTPDEYTLGEKGFERAATGASEIQMIWQSEGHDDKLLSFKSRYRFTGTTYELLWKDYATRYPTLRQHLVPSQLLLPTKVIMTQVQDIRGIWEKALRTKTLSKYGDMGTDQHNEISFRYTVDDSEKKYMHAYQHAYAFFPPVFDEEVVDDDDDDDDDDANDGGIGVGGDGDGGGGGDGDGHGHGHGAHEDEVASFENGSGGTAEEHNGCEEDSSEMGDVCDDETYGGLSEFDEQYLKRFSKRELDLIDSNEYDEDELDKEGEAVYASGLSDDQKRAVELQANLDRIQEHIQRREKLVQVLILSSAIILSCHYMLRRTTVSLLTLECSENSQEVSDAIWPRQYRILQRTEPTTSRVILAEDQSAVRWNSIKVLPDINHILEFYLSMPLLCLVKVAQLLLHAGIARC